MRDQELSGLRKCPALKLSGLVVRSMTLYDAHMSALADIQGPKAKPCGFSDEFFLYRRFTGWCS